MKNNLWLFDIKVSNNNLGEKNATGDMLIKVERLNVSKSSNPKNYADQIELQQGIGYLKKGIIVTSSLN